jgi:hypothetical protein
MDPARYARALALLATALLSAACATTHYTQSRIETIPPALKGKAGSDASLEIEGLKVRIQALDRTPEKEAIRRLVLRLVFEPRELGYSFDPGQVAVRTADGRESRATGGQYLPLYPKANFDLAFDLAVSPEDRVELVLGGLARGAKHLDPVRLSMVRRRGTSIDRMYWLEAIGYALFAPLSLAGYAQ